MQFCFIVAHRLFIVMKCKYAFGGRYTYEDILGGKIQNTAQAVDQYFHKGIGHHHRALYFGKELWRSCSPTLYSKQI